jgi:hypothetical protein
MFTVAHRFHPLLVLLTLLAACSSPTSSDNLELGPMAAYYPFDGNARDASGNVPAPDRFDNAGHAYAFNGQGAYVNTMTTFDFPERTVAFWFNMQAYTGIYQRIITQNSNLLDYGSFGAGVTADSLLEARAGGNGSFFPGHVKIQTGKWYHVALVRTDTLEIYYVNGVAVDTSKATPGGSYSMNTNFLIGSTRLPDRFFYGRIDDVRVYQKALSAAEVRDLYDAGS